MKRHCRRGTAKTLIMWWPELKISTFTSGIRFHESKNMGMSSLMMTYDRNYGGSNALSLGDVKLVCGCHHSRRSRCGTTVKISSKVPNHIHSMDSPLFRVGLSSDHLPTTASLVRTQIHESVMHSFVIHQRERSSVLTLWAHSFVIHQKGKVVRTDTNRKDRPQAPFFCHPRKENGRPQTTFFCHPPKGKSIETSFWEAGAVK
jgi:hypothetical protein